MNRWHTLVFCSLCIATLGGADWRQFRGSDSTGLAARDTLPREIAADKNVAWKVDLPGRGLSCPIVVGERVFVTASSGPKQDRLHVLAFDAGTGRKLWERTFWATGPTASHPKSCMAAPTPASDGKRVVAFFATNDLICLTAEGDLLWVRSLYEENDGATDGRGLASSPLLVGETVIAQVENQNTSFAAGIDLATGVNRWRLERQRDLNWSTPIALPGEKPGQELVLLQGSKRLSAVEPLTGREVWHVERHSDEIASSVLAGQILFVPGEKGLAAFELQGHTAPHQLWEKTRANPTTASPVVLDGRIYTLRNAFLVATDVKTGESVGNLRLKGPFSASPVAAGGLIYCVSEDGTVQVVEPDKMDGKVVGTGSLGETILGTPAIANGALYLRSDKHLWKFARQ